jgi:cytochrome c-type biogenesis protein
VQYLISFLEGIITFLSPCLLPMLPIYISYFAGGGVRSTRRTLTCAAGFVLGFTISFVAMGALAGTIGSALKAHQTAVNLLSGLVVIFFGLNFLGVFRIQLFRGGSGRGVDTANLGFFSSALFGLVFSVGWTPCVGAFLGSALMLASQQGHVAAGMAMLLAYSLGLGVPFLLSAVLIDRLKGAFDWIKRNYRIINIISGGLLVLVGILMATGTLGRLISLLS